MDIYLYPLLPNGQHQDQCSL